MGNRKSRRLLFASIGIVGGLVGAAALVLVLVARQQGGFGLGPEERLVHDHILKGSPAPSSVEFVHWGPHALQGEVSKARERLQHHKPSEMPANMEAGFNALAFLSLSESVQGDCKVIRVQYRGKSPYGTRQDYDTLAFVQNGKVVFTMPNLWGDSWLPNLKQL
jgi:hypothetical protein